MYESIVMTDVSELFTFLTHFRFTLYIPILDFRIRDDHREEAENEKTADNVYNHSGAAVNFRRMCSTGRRSGLTIYVTDPDVLEMFRGLGLPRNGRAG